MIDRALIETMKLDWVPFDIRFTTDPGPVVRLDPSLASPPPEERPREKRHHTIGWEFTNAMREAVKANSEARPSVWTINQKKMRPTAHPVPRHRARHLNDDCPGRFTNTSRNPLGQQKAKCGLCGAVRVVLG